MQYVVRPEDPARMARALLRFRLTRWQFWLPMLAALVGVWLLNAGNPVALLIAVELLCVGLLVASLLFRGRRLAATLAARGYRPGSVLAAEFDSARFTITTDTGSGVHEYAQVVEARQIGDVVLLRLGQARFVLALPSRSCRRLGWPG